MQKCHQNGQGERIKPVKERKANLKYNMYKVLKDNGYSGTNKDLEKHLS
jgi:hypothetical protein